MENKFPGKDISEDDLKDKFPLSSSKNKKKLIKVAKDISFGSNDVPIIAGPNTLENKDMISRCCELLEKKKLKLLRGGIYKPLTFPYRSKKYFELGDKGIRILEDIKKNFDVLIVSEIMESEKIPLIKDHVDIFQIGARNMQNYPLITNVAKTMKPILLKRHFGCSIRDLLGAAEYALVENSSKLIACRGSTAAFLGSGCVSIIKPSAPTARDARDRDLTHLCQKDAWVGSEIIGKQELSFIAGIA